MADKVYCMYCGISTTSIQNLTAGRCARGSNKGNYHVPYQGTEKSRYTCQHCGFSTTSISAPDCWQ